MGDPIDPTEIGYFLDAEEEYEKAMNDLHRFLIMSGERNRGLRRINEAIESRKASIYVKLSSDGSKDTVELKKAKVQTLLDEDPSYIALLLQRDDGEKEKVSVDADLEKAKARISLHKRRIDYATVSRNLTAAGI